MRQTESFETDLPIKDGIISGIAADTTVEALKGMFRQELGSIEVTDQDGSELADDQLVGTGCVVSLVRDPDLVYDSAVIAVSGDVDGDGALGVSDLLTMKSGILGRTDLEGAYFAAADVNADGVINIFDLVQLKFAILQG